jgi:PAS domain S-box-containing protein
MSRALAAIILLAFRNGGRKQKLRPRAGKRKMENRSEVDSELHSASPTDDRYRILVEAVTDYAIYMLDLGGHVTSWNAGARRIKGYDEAEILGEHFSRFYTEGDRQAGTPQKVLTIAARDGRFEGEGLRVRKDGSRFWASVIVDAIRDPAGKVVAFAKITRDLTERKQAEEVLRRSEEQFRLLVEGVTDYSIYMLDPDGNVATWNAGAERIKGYKPEEIIGQHFSRFYTNEDRDAGLPERAIEVAAREGRFEREGWRVRKDGTRFWANVVIDAIRDPTGNLHGFAKITRDVTERRDTEIALEKAREALFHSQKMEALGQLTGGIAHDFNNLLAVILGSLEIARNRVMRDPTVVRLVDNAIRGAERGALLTQRMLAFARRQEMKFEPVDIQELVRGMSELLEGTLGSSVTIETRFPLTLEWVTADRNQLEMALLNLIVNARDAMPQGGKIVLSAQSVSISSGDARLRPGKYVCFSVTDTGVGMDEATLARAIDPFFTTKGLGKGTGLGLSTVHGAVAQSGGWLNLKSQKDAGTTAELWLPVAPKMGAQVDKAGDPGPAPPTRRLTILVVDDDDLVLTNIAAMIEDLGHRVFEANSGRAALATLRREKSIDLVITDQVMPRMTGLQLIRTIREEWPELPVILATGFAELPQDTGAANPRLPKPFRQKDLRHAVNEALAKQSDGRVVRFPRH